MIAQANDYPFIINMIYIIYTSCINKTMNKNPEDKANQD